MASSHWLRIRAKVNATGLFISHHNALNYKMFTSRVTNITISDFVSVGGDCVKTNGRMSVLKIALFRMKTKHFYISLGSWWRHQIETFSVLLAICAGNSPVPGEFPAKRPVTRSFDVFFDLNLNKRLSKQWWGWWYETPSRPLWRHRNGSSWYSDTKEHVNIFCWIFMVQPY